MPRPVTNGKGDPMAPEPVRFIKLISGIRNLIFPHSEISGIFGGTRTMIAGRALLFG
jgi:hypothetical protein